jgi:hypothetical protein
MIKLKDLLVEATTSKGVYRQVTDKQELEDLSKELYSLINIAYKPIGGHVKITNSQDILRSDIHFWTVADLDDDPEVDVTVFGKNTPHGTKLSGIGHDGEGTNIKNLLKKQSELLKKPGTYAEVSGDAFRVFVEKGGVPTVDDESMVRKVLNNKEIEWHGTHPDEGGKKGQGWYSRKLANGKKSTKTLIGLPKR